MFTRNILSTVNDPELRAALNLDNTDTESRMSWIVDNIDEFNIDPIAGPTDIRPESLQQSDLLRKFYLTIAENGLKFTYNHANHIFSPSDLPKHLETINMSCSGIRKEVPIRMCHHVKPNKDKPVIIVGAGMSGMVAAYELKREGYNVEILETSQRFGGRVKTLGEKDGFDKGMHTDAGAMRLPLTPDKDRPTSEMIHYLTDYYAEKKFGLTPVPFSNHDSNAFYNFYGDCIKIGDWKDYKFTEYWPGWDKRLLETKQTGKIKNIDQYYNATVGVVIQLLKNRLKGIPAKHTKARANQWDLWTNNWCQFSFGSFLRSNLDAIKTQLRYDDKMKKDDPTLKELEKFLPWPEAAITAYNVFSYTGGLDVSLVSSIQELMGGWWSNNMHSLEGGLSALPNAFALGQGGMEQHITYNRTVTKVEYMWLSNKEKKVKVSGVVTSSGEYFSVEGRSVLLTVPLHILRGLEIVNAIKPQPGTKLGNPVTKTFPKEYQQAIQDISYSPATKIMLQYRKQFWNTSKDPSKDITGGFSKTNMPVGQVHYPTELVKVKKSENQGWASAPVAENQKGILMVYAWKAEALLFGALPEQFAIRLAVNQIDNIHPGIDTKELFEVGRVQAWSSDPTTLGAYAILRPREYISVLYLMQNSWRNVYFGGEAISFANGWIQGALESGLRAAFQLYCDDQPTPPQNIELMLEIRRK